MALDEKRVAQNGLEAIARAIRSLKKQHGRLVFKLGLPYEQTSPVTKTPQYESQVQGEVLAMATITNSQNLPLSVAFKDKKGQPAPVDGVPAWSVDNSELLSLKVAEDGLSAVVSAVAPLGTANVTLQADADLGEGVEPVIGTLAIDITGGKATVVEIVAGEPTEQE